MTEALTAQEARETWWKEKDRRKYDLACAIIQRQKHLAAAWNSIFTYDKVEIMQNIQKLQSAFDSIRLCIPGTRLKDYD